MLALFMVICGAAAANAEKRVALVVGNGAYRYLPTLDNPKNDAVDLARSLTSLGFEVLDGVDLDQIEFLHVLRQFERATRDADVALFFYAGHGIQVDGENYLAPVDAEIETESHVDLSMIPLRNVMRQINRQVRTGIVILDACRDNPFTGPKGRGASPLQKGLSRVEAPPGYFVAFATAPGKVASDGTGGRNSPFTGGLLEHITKPGKAISELMIDVRLDVEAATGAMQTPWDSSSLREPFYFAAATPAAAVRSLGTGDADASGASAPTDARDPARLAGLLRGFGIARVETNSNTGNPMIDGRADGKTYKMFFYGCTDNVDCKSVQFWAYWDKEVAVDKLNAWNRDTRYGKVYRDADEDVVLEYDVNMIHGMTERNFEDNVDIWVTLIARVEKEIIDE